jgi:ankyrin repeat protein
VLFFSSNNLLSEEQSDAFLKWVIDQKYTELLIGFFKHESPTLRAFAPRILEGAVRIVEPELVRRLLACSIDTHVLSGLNGGRLLRALCNTMWEASMADRDDYQHLLELVNILLNNGADPQKSNDSDDLAFGYPLYTAVFCNNIELAGLLVKAGADINHESDDPETGSTPIAFAIYRGQPAMVTFLLESGAKLRNSNVSGIPVLAWAATERPRIYQILRSHALGPPDKIDVPGIIYASRKGDSGLSDYLRGAGKRDETELTELLERALHTVVLCYSETLTPLEALLDIGVNANVPTQMENPPLVSALQNRMYDVAELLLSRGADPNAPGVLEECTSNFDALELVINHGADATKAAGRVLCIAALSHSLECIALLIESGADVNSRGHGLWSAPTPLQYLALYFNLGDSVKTATLLIGYGADVNAPASLRNGYTALQGAAREANLPLLRYYLDIGADVNAAPAKTGGMTALEASARNNGHKDKPTIFHLLVQAGAKLNRAGEESKSQATTSTLHALIETGSTDLACFAINAGADIDLKTCGKEGRTPLQRAAERGNLDIVKLLLQKGAKVNAPAANNFGRTALQAAAFCETPCMALVKLLLEHGAAINAKPAIVGGVTALQASAIRGYLPITLLLLESGADVNAKAAIKDGRTAIEGAAEHGRLDTVQLLINAGAIGDVGTGVQKAIDAAERNCHFAVADMLKEHQKTLDLFPVV